MRHGPVIRAMTKAALTSSTTTRRDVPIDDMLQSQPVPCQSRSQRVTRSSLAVGLGDTTSSVPADGTISETVIPVPVPEESALYAIPSNLSPIYRRIPTLANLGIWTASLSLSALSSFRKIEWMWIRSLVALRTNKVQWSKVLNFVVKTVVLALAFSVTIQETLLPPSRISTEQLVQKYFLPSKFSLYEPIGFEAKQGTDSTLTLGVHHLVCPAESISVNQTGLIYLNHGFGASSLSWLPAMRPLVERLGYRCAVAHDAPGFGFTARPDPRGHENGLEPYTSRGSSAIGCHLVSKFQKDPAERLVLMGHSMGAVTTLRMALQLPDHVETRIVLVAPALGLRPSSRTKRRSRTSTTTTSRAMAVRRHVSTLLQRVTDPIGAYVLRRAVGRRGFWRAGLQVAWGSAGKVSDTDVLRFQWPSIVQGWDRGLITFSRAQFVPMEETDQELLQQVLSRPNTTIHVIYGDRDRVVPPRTIQSFFQSHAPAVTLTELPGLGHDPFEEDVPLFVDTVMQLLQPTA